MNDDDLEDLESRLYSQVYHSNESETVEASPVPMEPIRKPIRYFQEGAPKAPRPYQQHPQGPPRGYYSKTYPQHPQPSDKPLNQHIYISTPNDEVILASDSPQSRKEATKREKRRRAKLARMARKIAKGNSLPEEFWEKSGVMAEQSVDVITLTDSENDDSCIVVPEVWPVLSVDDSSADEDFMQKEANGPELGETDTTPNKSTGDEVIFVDAGPAQSLVIDLDDESNASKISPAQVATSTPQKPYRPQERHELLNTPDSASNDFITAPSCAQQNFNFSLHGTDFQSGEFVKPTKPTETCETESSTSTAELNHLNQMKTVVFSEIEFPKDENLFAEANLESFGNFITPIRKSTSKEIAAETAPQKDKGEISSQTNLYESSDSSSESDFEGNQQIETIKKVRNLPTLSPIEKSAPQFKKKSKKSLNLSSKYDLLTSNPEDDTKKRKSCEPADLNQLKKKKKKKKKDLLQDEDKLKKRRSSQLNESIVEDQVSTKKKKKKRSEASEEAVEQEEAPSDENDKKKKKKKTDEEVIDVDKKKKKKRSEGSNEDRKSEDKEEIASDETLKKQKKKKKSEENNGSEGEGVVALSEKKKKTRGDEVSDKIVPEEIAAISSDEALKKKKKKRSEGSESAKDIVENQVIEAIIEQIEAQEENIVKTPPPEVIETILSTAPQVIIKIEPDDSVVEVTLPVQIARVVVEMETLPIKSAAEAEPVKHPPIKRESSIELLIDVTPSIVVPSDSDSESVLSALEEPQDIQLLNCLGAMEPQPSTSRQGAVAVVRSVNLLNNTVEEVKKTMSSDPKLWSIVELDRINYRDKKALKRCNRCKELNHLAIRCPNRLEPKCKLCGRAGHFEPRCPNRICLQCGTKSNYSATYCRLCFKLRSHRCEICSMPGHDHKSCPDLWRRYHLTTTEGPLVVATGPKLKPKHLLWCSGCAQQGHIQSSCPHLKPQYPPSQPCIMCYDQIYDVQQPARQPSKDNRYNHGDGPRSFVQDRYGYNDQYPKRDFHQNQGFGGFNPGYYNYDTAGPSRMTYSSQFAAPEIFNFGAQQRFPLYPDLPFNASRSVHNQYNQPQNVYNPHSQHLNQRQIVYDQPPIIRNQPQSGLYPPYQPPFYENPTFNSVLPNFISFESNVVVTPDRPAQEFISEKTRRRNEKWAREQNGYNLFCQGTSQEIRNFIGDDMKKLTVMKKKLKGISKDIKMQFDLKGLKNCKRYNMMIYGVSKKGDGNRHVGLLRRSIHSQKPTLSSGERMAMYKSYEYIFGAQPHEGVNYNELFKGL